MYVGWDWASEAHDATLITEDAWVIDRWTPTHDEQGIEAVIAGLMVHGDPADLPVAIEAADGLVIDRLLAAGFPVVPIHPNAFNAARPQWSASRAKSDPGDSYKLADYLRLNSHRLRRLTPTDQATREIRLLVRTRADHVEAKVAAANQLTALLDAYWPGAKTVFARIDSPIALAFIDRYPTPQAAASLGQARMAAFCKRHSYCGRRPAGQLLARLRHAPVAPVTIDPEVLTELVHAQARLLRATLESIAELDRAIKAVLVNHAKAQLLAPLPRIGEINLAQIVGEIGPILGRVDDVEQAAAEAGASPVTKESGGRRAVGFRWAVNTQARQALATFADNSRHDSAWAQRIYSNARARGKRHPHAIRILMRAWIRVIWACWHTNTPYDPTQHTARNRQEAA